MTYSHVTDKVVIRALKARGFNSRAQAMRMIARCERHLQRDEQNEDVSFDELDRRRDCIEEMYRAESNGDSAIKAFFDFWSVSYD